MKKLSLLLVFCITTVAYAAVVATKPVWFAYTKDGKGVNFFEESGNLFHFLAGNVEPSEPHVYSVEVKKVRVWR
jgi:hypothetical protein